MRSSDVITAFIMRLLEENNETEIKRNELAQQFNVVPSQINYVIASRFTPELGFMTESRRGGGGYIRIRRVRSAEANALMHVINCIGDSLGGMEARVLLENLLAGGYIEKSEFRIMSAALTDSAYSSVPPDYRDSLRAAVMKNMLVAVSAAKG